MLVLISLEQTRLSLHTPPLPHSITQVLLMLLKIQLFLFASLSAIAAQRVDPDVYASQPKQWMKYIKGNTRLTELSIPGTHDS